HPAVAFGGDRRALCRGPASVDHRLAEGRPPLRGDRPLSESIKRGFAPVVDAETRLLILGSLPGDASLKAAQYYAHPQNGFWRLVGGVIGHDLHDLSYGSRLEALAAAGIGLWDVIASAERAGSLDAAIRSPEAADLRGLITGLPNLRAVAFNGGASA